ncbi:flagellar type III secretion system pore protein FliP [Lysobacter sp.]|uniref:flagellar type III secretion system pore protein FliP n=1 Tax=Lysobacter sp. TaxID=72226 RepID=UPI002D41F8FE|nr:flagellar type III secretion system pore protein FliP [Lysobacter sp.]HZX78094.1 flagellar type III secretion system pore protein FliP [Lysobacter sp.]
MTTAFAAAIPSGLRRVALAALFALALVLVALTQPAFAQAQPQAAQAPLAQNLAATPSNAPSAASALSAPLPAVTVGKVGGEPVSMPMQVLLLMTGITLLPAALLGLTAFTRIIIVLGLLRQALGTGQTPSNQVLLALALFLTAMVMMPVFDQAWAAGIAPYLNDQMDFRSAWAAASDPFRGFMLAQIRENDLMTFAGLSNSGPYATPQDVPFSVLAASFLTSELKTAFEIAFLIYIPFVIIDLVVASVLMSMGMMMLSPMLISAPFKILLFVLVDGWVLVVGSLAASFNPV